MRYAMIMAGGAGTRLWPMSRREMPKQLIPFIARERRTPCSLLELAAERLDGVVPADRRYICTAERYRAIVRERLPAFDDERILGEPEGRDTVNAVGLTAAVLERLDRDAVFAVLTADHVIEPQEVFREAMDTGFRLVEQDESRLVTFAITPTRPETGYGYVRRGRAIEGFGGRAFVVREFKEKPDADTARRYVESMEYGWNSGMFVFHAAHFMRLLDRHRPESAAGLREIQAAWGTAHRARTLAEVYPTLPKISVDYAIMEPASRDPAATVCTVDMPVRWLDVGSWPSFAETLAPDANANRAAGTGQAIFHECRGSTVVTGGRPGHTVALLGCEGLIVVQTDEATLVMPAARAQELKDLHGKVADTLR